jgi:large repetitive protein
MLKRIATLVALTLFASAALAQQEHHQMTDDDFRAFVAARSSHGPVVPQPALSVVPTANKSFTITAQATSESSGYSFTVSPLPFTVTQGDTVDITFMVPSTDKSDAGQHGFLMETYFDGFSSGSQQPFNVSRGSSASRTFTATTSGSFAFVCNVSSCGPGHNNMFGTFTVNPNSNPSPNITGLNPSSGPTTGGTTVTISGSNFANGATVTFGGTAGTNVNVVSSGTITVVTPAHAAGSAVVVVSNPDSQFASSSPGFNYVVPSLTVTAISPASGSTGGGTPVTITGTNLLSGDTVKLGGTSATNVNVASSTSITATTPAHAAGKVDVVVAHSDGSSSSTLSQGFEYLSSSVTVTSVNPNTGPTSGNTLVTITGTNFQAGATVTFGGLAASHVSVVNSTTITALTPLGPANEQVSQPVSVVVTNPDSTNASVAGYTYTLPSVALASIELAAGRPTGGNTVTLLGAGFTTALSSSVTFGGVAATNVHVINAVTITVTVPAHAAGAVDVTVTRGTTSATLVNGYVYGNPPSKRRSAPH